MKKLLIGCGVLALLCVGALGYLTWTLWPELAAIYEQSEEFEQRIQALERDHAFDGAAQTELDTERFVTFLDLRTELKTALAGFIAEQEQLWQDADAGDVGVIESIRRAMRMWPTLFNDLLPLLEARGMSVTELGFSSRVLWATLENIDAGGASLDPSLNDLRGIHPTLRAEFDKHREEDTPTLEQLLSGIDARLVSGARRAMALDVARVQAGLLDPPLERILLLIGVGNLTPESGPPLPADVTEPDGAR